MLRLTLRLLLKTKMILIVAVCGLVWATPPIFAATHPARVRVSAWYWLNSVPKAQWPIDFRAMRNLGLTDVVLIWGFDSAAFVTRVDDSREAIRAAHAAGLGAYLFVWHARYSSLRHEARFEQVDAAGETLFSFDALNPQWRRLQWTPYLQKLARTYGNLAGMAGYVFDNSFAIGYIGGVDGPAPRPQDNYISYGSAEREGFGGALPRSPSAPGWERWMEYRRQGWAAWAKDTHAAIRAIDRNRRHQIVLEDGENTLDPDTESRTGLQLSAVTPYFDTMAAYWAPHYSQQKLSNDLTVEIQAYLAKMRQAIGPEKRLALSLRISDDTTEETAGHASVPTLLQLKEAIDAALAGGVSRVDLYGYRMGVYHLDSQSWNQYLPGAEPTYPLTGQIEGKFLADRPEVWSGLKTYLNQLGTCSGVK